MPENPLVAFLLVFVGLPTVVAALMPSALWGRRLRMAFCCALPGAMVWVQLACGHMEKGLLGVLGGISAVALVGILLYFVSNVLYVWVRMPVQWWRRACASEALPGLLLQADSEGGLSLHGELLCTDADKHGFVLRLAGEDVRLCEQKLPLRARMAGRVELGISGASLCGRLTLRRGVGFALELNSGGIVRRVEKMLVRKKCGLLISRIYSFEHEGWSYGFYPLRGCLNICGEGEPCVQELLIASAAWLAAWRFDDDLE